MAIDLTKYTPFAKGFDVDEYHFEAYTHNSPPPHFLVIVTKDGEDYDSFEVEMFYAPRFGVDIADINHLEAITDAYITRGYRQQ